MCHSSIYAIEENCNHCLMALAVMVSIHKVLLISFCLLPLEAHKNMENFKKHQYHKNKDKPKYVHNTLLIILLTIDNLMRKRNTTEIKIHVTPWMKHYSNLAAIPWPVYWKNRSIMITWESTKMIPEKQTIISVSAGMCAT